MASAISSSNIYLWVKPEPFDVGIIQIPPPIKLNHHNLRKLFAYAKNKGKAGYPRISYSVWKHVACNKLQIDENLAWTYFHTCEVLTENDSNMHLKNAEIIFAAKDETENAAIKEKRTVDLLKFILYLYIQHAHVISMKSPIVTGDEYPLRSRSSDLEGRAAIGIKGIDENAQMSFIINNITEILDLLVEPDTYGEDNDVMLTVDAVKILSFLIGATVDGRTVLSLEQAACQQKEAKKAGYSKISQMFSCRRLQSWIKAYLHRNPFGIYSCLTLGQKLRGRGYTCGDDSFSTSFSTSLSTSMSEDMMVASYRPHIDWYDMQTQLLQDVELTASLKSSQPNIVNRIITNANYSPDCSKRMICNQVCRRTVARTGDVLSNSMVNIHRCQHSHLYLMSPLYSVIIEKCHDSTVVLGAVNTVVLVIACENIQLVGVTKRIVIMSCRNSSFHLCTQSKPVLIGKNKSLKFAPYYTYYPHLESDMVKAGITPELNYWNQPLLLGFKKDEEDEIWREFPPKDFFKFVIPFDTGGTTKICPMHLPRRYKDALLKRERRIVEWHEMIRTSSLHKPQRVQLQTLVNERFQEWLQETGYNSLLESLAPPVPPVAPK